MITARISFLSFITNKQKHKNMLHFDDSPNEQNPFYNIQLFSAHLILPLTWKLCRLIM